MVEYSVVIPVYNSSNSLVELTQRIEKIFVEHKLIYEIILVNDGSSNLNTKTTLDLLQKDFNIKVHHLMRNFGKPAAILCGFKHAIGKYIITMDDDLQHLPEDIPTLIKARQHDLVIGKYVKSKHGLGKRLNSVLKNTVDYYFLNKPKGIKSGPFKLIKREVAKAASEINSHNPMISALLYYCTNDIVNVPVTHAARKEGKGAFTFRKNMKMLTQTLFSNSAVLLKLVAFIGLFVSAISVGIGLYFFIKKLTGHIDNKGWASTFVVISFTSGMLLFAIGIIGEYLVRIIHGVENKPVFIERKEHAED